MCITKVNEESFLMHKNLFLGLFFTTATLLSASDAGARLVEEKCTSCHMSSSGSTKLKNGKMGAPPMWGVMKKVKNRFKTKEEGVAFIIDYTMEPSETKMLFPAATKVYFGLMPSMRERLTDDEMSLIAAYLYQ